MQLDTLPGMISVLQIHVI